MSIFREYDIRGVVGKDLTPKLAGQIARAYGSTAVRGGAKTIAVARDGRTSAMEMREAVVEGLNACGLNVVDVGICPAFAITSYCLTVSACENSSNRAERAA